MLGFTPSAPFYDSFPILELDAWPGDEQSQGSEVFDIVDFLTATHAEDPAEFPVYESLSTDPRFVLSYGWRIDGFTPDDTAAHSKMFMRVFGGIGSGTTAPITLAVVPLLGLPSQIEYEPLGGGGTTATYDHGVMRLNVRRVQIEVRTANNAPTTFEFGAYFRVI